MTRLTWRRVALACIPLFLTGCLYGTCIDGPCALERARMLDASKPYGAHWIKEGMTRESRRVDIAACGGKGNESVNFLQSEIKAEVLPSDPNDINAYLRLRDRWSQCMRTKGYVHVKACDKRCLAP